MGVDPINLGLWESTMNSTRIFSTAGSPVRPALICDLVPSGIGILKLVLPENAETNKVCCLLTIRRFLSIIFSAHSSFQLSIFPRWFKR